MAHLFMGKSAIGFPSKPSFSDDASDAAFTFFVEPTIGRAFTAAKSNSVLRRLASFGLELLVDSSVSSVG